MIITREAVIESLRGCTVTSFKGRKPTPKDIDLLEKELGGMATRIKTTLFEGGERFGHLCLVLSDAAYGEKITNPAWAWEDNVPEEPTPYNPDITDNMGDVERRSMEAEWENHKAMVTVYNAVQECLVDRIAGAHVTRSPIWRNYGMRVRTV